MQQTTSVSRAGSARETAPTSEQRTPPLRTLFRGTPPLPPMALTISEQAHVTRQGTIDGVLRGVLRCRMAPPTPPNRQSLSLLPRQAQPSLVSSPYPQTRQ